MAKIKISAVINTRNEAANIAECLQSVSFADEIIVVDMESTDETVSIAREYTDKVFSHPAVGYVEPARNYAINKAIGDWILIIDADERVSKTLATKLIDFANSEKADFLRIPRKNMIFGQWIKHSRWWPDLNIRFFKKGSVEWQNEIHSIPITYGTGVNLTQEEELAIIHYHYKTIDEYIERSLRYSRQQSKELLDSGYKFDPADLITKPVSEFISRFFAGEGYRDGLHGLVLAFLQSFSILLIYIRVWESHDYKHVSGSEMSPIWQKSFIDKLKELNYWFFTVKIQGESSKVKRFIFKLKRRLSR